MMTCRFQTLRIMTGAMIFVLMWVWNLLENRFPVAIAEQWFEVQWVVDGDTIVLADRRRVRYLGVNAPEISHDKNPAEPFGYEAKAINEQLVNGLRVRLELDEATKDQYGRTLAYVYLENGTIVNAELIKRGGAHFVFRAPNTRYNDRLLALQRHAMEERVGLWGEGWKDERQGYMGHLHSKRFHRTDCALGQSITLANRRFFQRRYAAFWAGYSPCKKCRP